MVLQLEAIKCIKSGCKGKIRASFKRAIRACRDGSVNFRKRTFLAFERSHEERAYILTNMNKATPCKTPALPGTTMFDSCIVGCFNALLNLVCELATNKWLARKGLHFALGGPFKRLVLLT